MKTLLGVLAIIALTTISNYFIAVKFNIRPTDMSEYKKYINKMQSDLSQEADKVRRGEKKSFLEEYDEAVREETKNRNMRGLSEYPISESDKERARKDIEAHNFLMEERDHPEKHYDPTLRGKGCCPGQYPAKVAR